MTRTALLPAALLILSACGSADAPAPNAMEPVDQASPATGNALPPPDVEMVPPSETEIVEGADAAGASDWVGRWTGPEGLVLDVEPRADGAYGLAMQYTLDDRGEFVGHEENGALVFDRDGQTRRLTPATGDETGMKWLAGKRDCLVVVPQSEAYCRD